NALVDDLLYDESGEIDQSVVKNVRIGGETISFANPQGMLLKYMNKNLENIITHRIGLERKDAVKANNEKKTTTFMADRDGAGKSDKEQFSLEDINNISNPEELAR